MTVPVGERVKVDLNCVRGEPNVIRLSFAIMAKIVEILRFGLYRCQDTDNGNVDMDGDSCENYVGNEHWCGNYDTDTFQSNDMCCACGGGKNYFQEQYNKSSSEPSDEPSDEYAKALYNIKYNKFAIIKNLLAIIKNLLAITLFNAF